MSATQYPHIGSLDTKVVIQQPTASKSAKSGSVTDSWSTFKTVYAAVDFRSGTEEIDSSQKVAKETKTFTIRYISGILPTMRIVLDGQNYNIQGPSEEIGRKRFLKLNCKAIL